MGEPAGIGGEILLKAWAVREGAGLPPFFAIDDPDRLRQESARLNQGLEIAVIEHPKEAPEVFSRALPVLPLSLPMPVAPGKPDAGNAATVLTSLRRAVGLAREGLAKGVVTSPIHKKVLYTAGFRHPGHTEYLAELLDARGPAVMMLVCPGLRVVPVTVHLALKRAIEALTEDAIVHAGSVTHEALHRDFGIERPRLAVAGLNPHAGESGSLGREEIEIVEPAIAQLRALGIDAVGPAPADTLFHEKARGRYDAALCLYHDQALIPLKTIDFNHGVNVTLGLPIVRTSPDHGTALDIAGQGIASPSSLMAAISLAGEMAERRATSAVAPAAQSRLA
jgi:4-hydroxythreonine-4-phosphate dehydrogenase